ncbi:MAG: DUF177 domain-containing protein [Sphingomonadales bacterium]|nr:DUF177 domain-containing protein [Sphingomonadales bacterium]
MIESEFSRMVDTRQIGGEPMVLQASEAERAALALRFALVSIDALVAELRLTGADGAVNAAGRLTARIVQSCAVSGEDLPVTIDEPLSLRFVPESALPAPGEDDELSAEDCDDIPFTGHSFDLGEAVAQSLALAIDPYAEGPGADEFRRKAGLLDERASGPFAALAALASKNQGSDGG